MWDAMTIIKLLLIALLFLIVVDFIGFMIWSFNSEKIHSGYKYGLLIPETAPVSHAHKANIERGRTTSIHSSVVICCLCRDIEKCFLLSKARVEKLGSFFRSYDIVLFENDSKDKSRTLLNQWSLDNSHIHLLNCTDVDLPMCRFNTQEGYKITHSDRIKNMCFCRNRYLDYVKRNYAHADFLIVYDFDLEGGLLESGIYDSIGRKEDWDAMFANGRFPLPPFGLFSSMYDSLAFVKNNDSFKDPPLKRFWNLWYLNGDIGDPLIPVMSAFNGLAIYKISSILESEYNSSRDCEHIGFHDDMREKGHGKVFINPSMLLYAGMQGPQNKFWAFWNLSGTFLKNENI